MSKVQPLQLPLERAHAEHLAYRGPGLTFGELAIGELFEWAKPIPVGTEPIAKASATRYEWSGGYGTAEAYYRVERWPRE